MAASGSYTVLSLLVALVTVHAGPLSLYGIPGIKCTYDYTCPPGQKVQQNPAHNNTGNGCGPAPLNVDPLVKLTCCEMLKCCDAHDTCYGTCGKTYSQCNGEMLACLLQGETDLICKPLVSLLMITVVDNLGCIPYKSSQKGACQCQNE